MTSEWWRSAVIYQIYPRSFADASGDGVGDLPGITARLDSLADLGVDAVWLSPFMTSPQADGGYDVADFRDVDPLFGDLSDFDSMIKNAHTLGIRVIIDLVPNHASAQHPWFVQALAAGPGSAERARFHFRNGRGSGGELPPNNWESIFGGSMWTRVDAGDHTPAQWYLHLFDPAQPDFNWSNPEVRAEFRDILRFWLDRGVDGFRVDVAHGLIKADGLPDHTPRDGADSMGGDGGEDAPYFGQPEVHDVYRDWRILIDSYPGERVLCAEAWMPTLRESALWVRSDEMHQAFNFPYVFTRWDADALRTVIIESLEAFGEVGAPTTWVLSNHDVVRHTTRLALSADSPQGHGIGPLTPGKPDPAIGWSRGRAATTVMLALPGSAYLYQGEELGLPEVVDLPDEVRQDPTWFRTGRTRYGRDGCRVPIPWSADAPAHGFSPTGKSWLPQPDQWNAYARDQQAGVPGSTLELYRSLIAGRGDHGLGSGTLCWLDGWTPDVLSFSVEDVVVIANTGTDIAPAPAGMLPLIASGPLADQHAVPPDTAAWFVEA
ncbi:glycoside hydrolase family 13 protein [Naumannella halotolerans]|uniref:Alpha-glucosidase n=1 Tax=Naumannella halotolerans TaxID=993414 RepID=A0A4R7IYM8_9ACTN|nr:glycoside hydrolase family 13 protein [Naumannella halotolerans]TDT29810.1 alpha-glucosidase [Naumannella halotolerans]